MEEVNNTLDLEKDLKIKALEDELSKANKELTKLRIMLQDMNVEFDSTTISDEETIAVQQIGRLKEISNERDLTSEEVKNFDLLHKNLRLAKSGRDKAKGDKAKDMSPEELMKVLS